MAYKNLIAISLNNPSEVYRHLRAFIVKENGTSAGVSDYSTTGIGWTLIEDYCQNGGVGHYYDRTGLTIVTVNDYFVIYSAGENGQRNMYFKIKYVANYFEIYGYLSYSNVSHTGTQQFGTTGSWTQTSATNSISWFYGDLDQFFGISKYGTSYQPGFWGWFPESSFDQSFISFAGSITSGSNKTVTFASTPPSAWVTGKKLFVSDNTNLEQVTITAKTGNDVTFASFANSYASGCVFTQERSVS